jgi:protein involved in polysaccharide export with SLBB domain
MANGKVRLPLAGEVEVSGMNLSQAQQAIDDAYSPNILKSPKTSVLLAESATFNIPVLGELTNPGVHPLPKYHNDIANALAMAGGLTPFAAEVVEVHRRMPEFELVRRVAATVNDGSDPQSGTFPAVAIDPAGAGMLLDESTKVVLRIPLKSGTPAIIADNQVYPQEHLSVEDITLKQGDVIVVPRQQDEVFFVVGPLSKNNVVNFRVSELDRRLGNAFLLPRDRDVDVVTAVAMAGYIDPIDSPTTVTVHRSVPGATPMLIRVDLIAARYNWNENVYVQPGDIIYLNPDAAWWSRRIFDQIAPDLLLAPYREAMFRWINPRARIR